MRDEASAVALPLHHRVRHGLRHPANWLQLVRLALVGASGYVANLAIVTATPLSFLGQKLWSFRR